MANQENFDDNIGNSNAPTDEYISGEDYREKMQALSPQTQTQMPAGLSWQQKAGVAFLAIFGVSALILWAVQFKSGLQVTEPLTAEELVQLQKTRGGGNDTDTAAQLRSQDTDKDGLSDYDELYVYGTSPYLEDSDSDGILDKKEIERETDPNCSQGKVCAGNEQPANAIATTTGPDLYGNQTPQLNTAGISDYLQQSKIEQEAAGASQNQGAEQQIMQSILQGKADAQSLRAMLKQAGMDDDTLGKISDEQLIQIYQQTLKGQE
ncbi:hypothetical protein COU00_00180 [Candidatus Falkowbacteria bacterium CG10_big_fil_rev_8_21_14_0_10_43_11]|uniref:EF-hand domain-containing protein n=1 Tax=Candidatus Falkowbacteria bacterium CG10_big_fil_rev_8_21_14_0_10_43_11 TaxID=1974568 RepID=A0A2M6WN33_9BACT|nr:MAG: hypothetical protein COU00_00180 [Candidatus Falkowbacteria bacterium CG10_big_fil_rev_8_21_14_0_10_43_11]